MRPSGVTARLALRPAPRPGSFPPPEENDDSASRGRDGPHFGDRAAEGQHARHAPRGGAARLGAGVHGARRPAPARRPRRSDGPAARGARRRRELVHARRATCDVARRDGPDPHAQGSAGGSRVRRGDVDPRGGRARGNARLQPPAVAARREREAQRDLVPAVRAAEPREPRPRRAARVHGRAGTRGDQAARRDGRPLGVRHRRRRSERERDPRGDDAARHAHRDRAALSARGAGHGRHAHPARERRAGVRRAGAHPHRWRLPREPRGGRAWRAGGAH